MSPKINKDLDIRLELASGIYKLKPEFLFTMAVCAELGFLNKKLRMVYHELVWEVHHLRLQNSWASFYGIEIRVLKE